MYGHITTFGNSTLWSALQVSLCALEFSFQLLLGLCQGSSKVSYYSYKIAKILHLDFEQTAIGGLLHDFFLSPEDRTQKERLVSVFTHPKQAVSMAKSQFELTAKEEDMIRSHMFPINLSIPKYAESWIVSLVDKCVATNEFALKFRFRVKYAYNLFLLFAISIMKI